MVAQAPFRIFPAMAWLALLATALLTGTSALAATSDTEDRRFQTAWFIQPSTNVPDRKTIAKGEAVFRQRLLPPTLVTLSDDVVDAGNGKTLLKAGEQLFGVLSAGAPIFCRPGIRDTGALKSLLIGTGNRQQCYVDLDADGRLDGYFTVGNAIRGLPNFSGKRPKSANSLQGGSYVQTMTAEMKVQYFVAVTFAGKGNPLISGKPIFEINFGTAESRENLTNRIVGEVPDKPQQLHILGSSFSVFEVRGDGIDVEIQQNIPAQPFSVIQEMTWTIR